jgi:hypothetical protein
MTGVDHLGHGVATDEALVAGLRVRLISAPGTHTVGACLRVTAGSSADPARPWGTAHLTEHIRIAAALDDGPSGCRSHITGRTENAETRFTVAALPEQSHHVVRTMVRLLDHEHAVNGTVFETERHAVALEMRAVSANPLLLLGPAAAEAAVPDGRLADTARATQESLDRITPADVGQFAAEHYRPESAVLAFAAPSLDRERVLETIATTLAATRTQAPSACGDGDRPALTLSSDVDGLLVLTLPSALLDPVRRSAVRTLASSAGPIVTRTTRAGHPLLGSTVIAGEEHEVTVLCWRDEQPGDRLRQALATAFADVDRPAGAEVIEAWRGTVRQEYQEQAFAQVSPLGRAQWALLSPPPVLTEHAMPDEMHRAARAARLWRVRAGVLHAVNLPES